MQAKATKVAQKFNNIRGQGVMEYIIISGLIGIFCLGMVKQFGGVLQTRLEHMKATIVKEID